MKTYCKHITYIGISFFFFLTGCKSPEKVGTVNITDAKAHEEFFESMQEQAFKFNTLSARLNVDLKIPGKEISSRVDLKMIKDSIFQLSVQPFLGIEVFKVEISLDSIKIIDRLNKRYVVENYAELKGQTPVEFNFYNLQALFINHIFLPGEKIVSPKQYHRFLLKQEGATAEIRAKDSMGLLYTFMADGEEKLLSTYISEASNKHALQWVYEDFRLIEKQPFPMLMDVQYFKNGSSEGGLKIYFNRIQTDIPVNMDFSIPNKYKAVIFADIIKSLSSSKSNS